MASVPFVGPTAVSHPASTPVALRVIRTTDPRGRGVIDSRYDDPDTTEKIPVKPGDTTQGMLELPVSW
ncbi:hypothetical protein [Streptomyces sp. NPDC002671]